MKKKFYFLSVLSTVNTVILMQYICKERKKQSQLLFSILNNYSIYKLFRITNTQTHTHSQTHASTYILSDLGFILSAGGGNESCQSPWSEREPVSLPHTYLPGIMTSVLPSISWCRAHCQTYLHGVSFYNLFLFKLQAFRKHKQTWFCPHFYYFGCRIKLHDTQNLVEPQLHEPQESPGAATILPPFGLNSRL